MKLRRQWRNRKLRRRVTTSLMKVAMDRFCVRMAHTAEEHEDAYRLIKVSYASQGYVPVRSPDMRIHPQHVLPEATVWNAYEGSDIVGTITTWADSPAGLPLDKDYREQNDALRARGCSLAEVGALAIVERSRGNGLLSLLQMVAFWSARHLVQATDVVIGINPKAVPYHGAVLGFDSIATPQAHAQLRAPVQGMLVNLDHMQDHLRRNFPRPMSTGGLFCEHMFETLPGCVEQPPARSLAALARWKLPRESFRELFITKSDTLASLDQQTRDHLESWRSLGTLAHQSLSK